MIGTIIPVTVQNLRAEVERLKNQSMRLVTITCSEVDAETLDLLYHFDKELELTHLRLAAAKTSTVPSISGIYFAAFAAENEIQDLFGLCFTDLAVDFQRSLYLDNEVKIAPLCNLAAEANESTNGEDA